MGGNMETDKTKARMSPLPFIFSFAMANAVREPMTSERMVVEVATIRLFAMILRKG
jgi:hypothetical protein